MELSDRRYHDLVQSIGRGRTRGDNVVHIARPGIPFEAGVPLAGEQIQRQSTVAQTLLADRSRGVKRILLVDTDAETLHKVQRELGLLADTHICSDFGAARSCLADNPPDLLVTNIRLKGYNGLHLVHVSRGTPTRCIVYATHHDLVLAREVQAAGAFYERSERVSRALASYARAVLPAQDRRSVSVLERRRIARGGRRCTDV